MQYSNAEIINKYNQADNKAKSIKILAELNGCTKDDIKKVLIDGGVVLSTTSSSKDKETLNSGNKKVRKDRFKYTQNIVDNIKSLIKEGYSPQYIREKLALPEGSNSLHKIKCIKAELSEVELNNIVYKTAKEEADVLLNKNSKVVQATAIKIEETPNGKVITKSSTIIDEETIRDLAEKGLQREEDLLMLDALIDMSVKLEENERDLELRLKNIKHNKRVVDNLIKKFEGKVGK